MQLGPQEGWATAWSPAVLGRIPLPHVELDGVDDMRSAGPLVHVVSTHDPYAVSPLQQGHGIHG